MRWCVYTNAQYDDSIKTPVVIARFLQDAIHAYEILKRDNHSIHYWIEEREGA